jgi:hypothetical protein
MFKSAWQDSVVPTVGDLYVNHFRFFKDSTDWNAPGRFSLASIDLGARAYESYVRTTPNNTGLVAFSILANFLFCPRSLAGVDPCANQNPFIEFNGSTAITGGNIILPPGLLDLNGLWLQYDLGDMLLGPILNFVQLAQAAARIDLGNAVANNSITTFY